MEVGRRPYKLIFPSFLHPSSPSFPLSHTPSLTLSWSILALILNTLAYWFILVDLCFDLFSYDETALREHYFSVGPLHSTIIRGS